MKIYSWYTILLSVAFLLVWYDLTTAEIQSYKEEERPVQKQVSRERRAAGAAKLGLVLVGTALGVSVANIGYDAWLTSGGCCKKKPNVCKQQREVKTLKDDWLKRANEIDDKALNGSKKITFINSIHTNNEIVKTKLVKIIRTIDQLVKTLADDDLNELKELQQKIDRVQKENAELLKTWTMQDIDLAFKGLWGSPAGMATLFAPLFFEIGSHGLNRLYQGYKVRKISKALGPDLTNSIIANSNTHTGGTKAFKMMGRANFNNGKLLKETSMARYKASRTARSRYTKVATTAFTLFTIGIEAWHIYENDKKCRKSRKEIKKIHKMMKEELAKLDDSDAMIEGATALIEEAYSNLTNSLSSDEFLLGVQSIANLVDGASTQNNETKETVEHINWFMNNIKGAVEKQDSNAINDMQKLLSGALDKVQYTYDCYLKKAEAITSAIRNCKLGSSSLEDLYNVELSKMKACVIDPEANTTDYMSLETLQTALSADAKKNGYYDNCLLNNKDKIENICETNCDYYPDVEDVAEEFGITTSEVNMVCKAFQCELSRRDVRTICKLKGKGASLEELVADFGAPFKDAIKEVYNDC